MFDSRNRIKNIIIKILKERMGGDVCAINVEHTIQVAISILSKS